MMRYEVNDYNSQELKCFGPIMDIKAHISFHGFRAFMFILGHFDVRGIDWIFKLLNQVLSIYHCGRKSEV